MQRNVEPLDYAAGLYQVVFVCNLVLALYGLIGFCAYRITEVFRDVKMEALLRRYKIDKIKIKIRDIFLLISYGWYLLIPGVVFACIQGYSVIELQEKGAEVLSAVKKSEAEVSDVLFFYITWIPVGAIATM